MERHACSFLLGPEIKAKTGTKDSSHSPLSFWSLKATGAQQHLPSGYFPVPGAGERLFLGTAEVGAVVRERDIQGTGAAHIPSLAEGPLQGRPYCHPASTLGRSVAKWPACVFCSSAHGCKQVVAS